MALQKLVRFGGCFDATYHRISHVVIEVPGARWKVRLESFADQQDRYAAVQANWFRWYPIEWSGNTNYISDAYEVIKALPEWAGAIDV